MSSQWWNIKRPPTKAPDTASSESSSSNVLAAAPEKHVSDLRGNFSVPVIGETVEFAQNPFSFVSECVRRYGPVFRANIACKTTAIAASYRSVAAVLGVPQAVAGVAEAYAEWMNNIYTPKSNLLLMDDSCTRSQLKAQLEDALSSDAIKSYWPTAQIVIDRHLRNLRQLSMDSAEVDIYVWAKALFDNLTAVVILGESVDADASRNLYFAQLRSDQFNMMVSIPYQVKIPFLKLRNGFSRGLEARDALQNVIRERIARIRTRSRTAPPKSVLEHLVHYVLVRNERCSDGEDADEVVVQQVLMLSNNVVTKSLATSLAYLLFELAGGPQLAVACRKNSAFLHACLQESLRLHPPLLGGIRFVSEQNYSNGLVVDGVNIPCGSRLWYSCRHANTDPAIYERATDFDPSRWMHQETYSTSALQGHGYKCPFQYPCAGDLREDQVPSPMTFGGGDHKCPGRDLSWGFLFEIAKQIIECYDLLPGPLLKDKVVAERSFPVLRPASQATLRLRKRTERQLAARIR